MPSWGGFVGSRAVKEWNQKKLMAIKITVKALILRYYELMEHAYHLPTNIIEIREDEGS